MAKLATSVREQQRVQQQVKNMETVVQALQCLSQARPRSLRGASAALTPLPSRTAERGLPGI